MSDIQDIEECFLGSLLLANPETLSTLKIKPHYFFSAKNGKIFETFFKQLKDGTKPNIVTLCQDPDLKDIQKSYITGLTNKVPSAENLTVYENQIIDSWQLRTLETAEEKYKEKLKAAHLAGGVSAVVQEYIGLLSGALCDKHADSFITFDDYINSRAKKEYWREFTPKLFGTLPFPDGTISALGARPGHGKSAALVNLCRELLTTESVTAPNPREYEIAQNINAKRKILFISAEMSTEDITDRLIHSLAWQTAGPGQPYFLEGVEKTNRDYWKLLKYKYGEPHDHWEFSQKEKERAGLYKNVIEKYIRPAWGDRLKIAYVRGRKSFDDIYGIILNNAEPGTLVLMDYLQRMPICNSDIGQGNPRYLEIRHIMDMGIIAAEKTQAVIIAAAQLGREKRKGEKQADDTQGWRESGDIEQTAWNLIEMWRERKNDKDLLSFKITKARSSEGVDTGFVWDDWIPGYQYINNARKTVSTKPKNETPIPEETKIGGYEVYD